ncbi:MAG: CbiM family transporter [Verrucomicrobia bacterium]|nr:CbiM family transporter [Verrucomicrobiota bacterium]
MHIPDGFLDAKTCLGTGCLAVAGLTWATRQVQARWNERTVPLIGVMAAFLFAGQTVNFPIASGTSGHLLGGVLAAMFLGPYGAAIALSTVLVVQSFLFQDGGVTALGANITNMGLVASFGGYAICRALRRCWPGRRGAVLSASVAAWASVVLAAAACALELAAAGTIPLRTVLPAMTLTHAVIGLGEAVITAAVVSFILQVRPDLVFEPGEVYLDVSALKPLIGCGLLAALGVALLLRPLASTLPDGLESVGVRLEFLRRATHWMAAPLADYEVPGVAGSWLGGWLAVGIGVMLTFGLGWAIARWMRRPRPNVDGR